ncbi:hypothetical protein SAMN05443429_1123 [Cruoricaptor ignavus]|uniref:Phage integrase SAM-like domain-containing protein n=1 Tax=Cruoricaptor ignavus TaxID=1118202 RepID=A0A1M6HBT5_9FLAO|nr:site-specific integrase [Cruoricaptor ignavus]SHJ19584.1 hypothetical protein SAMN05443429_1123 [Cruoricaptor ignavus]
MNEVMKSGNLPVRNVRIKFVAVVRQFLRAAENGEILTPDGNIYSGGSIRTYKTFLMTIEKYEEKYGTVYIDEISPHWAELYRNFLTSELEFRKNTISTNIAKLKSIVNRAHLAGLTMRTGFGIRQIREESVQIYLSWKDLQTLYNYEFDSEAMSRIRDIFIMHCFCGMRISDFLAFIRNPKKFIIEVEEMQFIHYFSQKTKIEAVVPMHTMIKKILEKHNYDFGRKFSYQHYNYYLKKIGFECGLTDTVRLYYTKGGEFVEETVPKYSKISSHTARRTFASLAELAKIDRPSIMKITGHKTEGAFMSYIRIGKLESAIDISNHNFFSREL